MFSHTNAHITPNINDCFLSEEMFLTKISHELTHNFLSNPNRYDTIQYVLCEPKS